MAGRRPGITCSTLGDWIDPGTSCLNLNPAPIVVGLVVVTTTVVVKRAIDGVRRDVDRTLDEIAALPASAQRRAAYEFFASFFDRDLPKKFIHHYVYGHGHDLTLTEQEMKDCNPKINVNRCKAFQEKIIALNAAGNKTTIAVNLACPAGAYTNGTLGQFTVHMKGTLDYRAGDDWELSGRMHFYDEWDFDPKDFDTGGRSLQGELKTRFAHYTLPGDGFKIDSPEVPFKQSAKDTMVNWAGGAPKAELDNVAKDIQKE